MMRVNRVSLLIAATLSMQFQIAGAFADETSKKKNSLEKLLGPKMSIPKDRYRLIYDAVPFEMQGKGRANRTENFYSHDKTQIQFQIEMLLYSRLKSKIKDQFNKLGPLSCELEYELGKDKRIFNVQVIRPSTNPAFTAASMQAVNSIGSNFVCAPYEISENSLRLQSVLTPDGVYPGFTGKVFDRILYNMPSRNPILDKPCE